MTKKKVELNPIIEDNTEMKIEKEELSEIAKQIKIIKTENSTDNINNYYKNIIDKLMSPKDISLKTHFLNVKEVFNAVQLEILAKYGNMPYLHDLLQYLEIKRVSLERLSRKEIVRSLEKRDEDVQMDINHQRLNQFGYR